MVTKNFTVVGIIVALLPVATCIARVPREIVDKGHIDHQIALPAEVDVSDLQVPGNAALVPLYWEHV